MTWKECGEKLDKGDISESTDYRSEWLCRAGSNRKIDEQECGDFRYF